MTPTVTRTSGRAALVAGEFHFSAEDFRRIAAVLHGDSGIHLQEAKAPLVYSRLAKRLRALGLESFRDYCELVESGAGAAERRSMLTALTTNVTRFFREPHHFDALSRDQLPALAAAARSGARVRLWSAGCSTGQEPYSMAMSVLDAIPDAPDRNVKILATDIDPAVVETGREGVYSEEALQGIPERYRKWLERAGPGQWRMARPLRSIIAFRELNLFSGWPFTGKFDAIFCRNVAIYFETSAQARLWTRFAERLQPDGRLYVGHSERVSGRAFESCGLTAYRLARGVPA